MSTNSSSAIEVPVSPYADQKLTTAQHLVLSLYWFATNFHWGALLLIVMPRDVERLNPEFRVETLGLLTGVGAIVALLVPLLAGALSDRCFSRQGRRKPYIATGVTINVIGLGVMAAAIATAKPPTTEIFWTSIFSNGPLLLFFFGFLIIQLGNNIASAAYMGVIPDLVPPDQRGAASGFMAMMTQGGTILGGIAVGVVIPADAFAIKYSAIAAIMILAGVVTWNKMQETPLSVKPPRLQLLPYLKSLWIDPRQYPDFAWVWITRFLVMLGFYAILPYVNYYLADVLRIPRDKVDTYAPLLMTVILIAASVSGFYGGRISDRIGRKRVVYIANSMIAVVALGFVFARTLPVALFVGFLFGLGYGAYISVDYALGTDVLPSKADAGKDMAVWHIAMTLPQSLASPFAAVLISGFGKTVLPNPVKGEGPIVEYTVNGYAAIFLFCSISFAVGAYLLKNVRGVR